MPATIHYYFTSISPFTYLGHDKIVEVARAQGAELAVKPVELPVLWASSGSVPLGQRSPTRQRYRIVELQRIADFRGLALNPRPKFFPADGTLADLATVALVDAGADPLGFMRRVFSSVWVDEEDIADEAVIAQHLEAEGHDPDRLLAVARSPEAAAIRRANSEEAVAADAIGVPAYVVDGEAFWGEDRIEHLEHALATGRAPFRAV